MEAVNGGPGLVETLGPVHPAAGRPVVFFDGDDTLWLTEPLYDAARALAARVVADAGLDAGDWERLERAIDVKNVVRFGLSSERFPTSCVEAYEEIVRDAGASPDLAVAQAVRRSANSVFSAVAPLVNHVVDTLDALRDMAALFLLTQGDLAVQIKRIEDSGLSKYFDGVFITPTKSPPVLRSVLDQIGSAAEAAVFVGNSIASDINPALSVGMRAIWIDAHVWEHERRETLMNENSQLLIADGVKCVPHLLGVPS